MKEDLRAFWRNEFASAALEGFIAVDTEYKMTKEDLARHAREHADALLLELERNPIPPKEA